MSLMLSITVKSTMLSFVLTNIVMPNVIMPNAIMPNVRPLPATYLNVLFSMVVNVRMFKSGTERRDNDVKKL